MTRRKTTEEFVRDAILVHSDKYDYSKVEYIGSNNKIIIICQKHGDFLQRPNHHLRGVNCVKCSGNYMPTTEEWITKSIKIHNNTYNYSKVIYKNSDTKVIIICQEHGEFLQTPHSHLTGVGCAKCSGNYIPTTEEWILKAKEIHIDKYDYSKVKYIRNKSKVIIICKIHGEFLQNPINHSRGEGCSKCAGKYITNY